MSNFRKLRLHLYNEMLKMKEKGFLCVGDEKNLFSDFPFSYLDLSDENIEQTKFKEYEKKRAIKLFWRLIKNSDIWYEQKNETLLKFKYFYLDLDRVPYILKDVANGYVYNITNGKGFYRNKFHQRPSHPPII